MCSFHRFCASCLLSAFAVTGMSAQQASPGAPQALAVPADDKPLPDLQLPDLHLLFAELDRNQKAAEAAQEDYTYHLHKVTETLDGKGGVKKTVVTDEESLTVQGVRVDRVVARDGKPLSADEARKEDARIDKDVAKAKERRAKAEAKDRETDTRGNELITASRFLELGKFSNERRELLYDRPTIVVDYAGDPDAKTHNPAENAVRDLVGTVWIDETDRTLVRADGHFLKDFKVYGGLALDIRKDTTFSFRSRKINGEAWLPEQIDADGHLRAMLFVGFTGRFHMTATDYRKFHTSSTIVGSNGVIGGEIPPPANPLAEPQQLPQPPKP